MGQVNIDNVFLKANSLLKKGKNDEAISLYQNLLLKFPKNFRAKEGIKKIGVLMTPKFEKELNQMLVAENFNGVVKYTEQLIENFSDNFVICSSVSVSGNSISKITIRSPIFLSLFIPMFVSLLEISQVRICFLI